ncbi:endopeptidase La [Porphyromonas sp. oral taxon 278]|uniref:endopeptidase La n=1 Tax=Porphyromonas sp. oral taxon 278 TaxID=712437 RepID=UPI0025DE41C6|nr:endopeptidase La [Porphyromonas sp. oral taxon 278]
MTAEDQQHVLAIPVLATYGEEDSFALPVEEQVDELPLIALRNMSIFPGTLVPILVGRKKSMQVIRQAEKDNKYFGVVTQRDAGIEDPKLEDLYTVGTVVEVSQIIELPSGEISAILRGRQRFTLESLTQEDPYLSGKIKLLDDTSIGESTEEEFKALTDLIHERTLGFLEKIAPSAPAGFLETIRSVKNRAYIIHLSASLLQVSTEVRQEMLEAEDLSVRGLRVLAQLQAHIQESDIKESILSRTRQEMDQQQREYFLQQQMRTIQDELGTGASADDEIEELRKKGADKLWSESVAETFEKELRKAERLNPQSPDFSVQMQYLRTIVDLPWGVYSQDNFDLKGAKEILDREHYGLDRVKERILEHLAVLKLKGDMKSPILCLYGPPGVGKTSLGRSVAESLGRQYVRISLGGVHDEAEIRGHRRTYIGAMSGRIIQSLQKAGTSNPVFVLDEIDKLSSDYKGDPASALLEVLDPEQNTTFHDNYLDIDYDLSKVLFIATANNISTIPQALRDRMELIEVTGYIAEEKLKIAEQHLVPKEAKEHGLKLEDIHFAPGALDLIIEEYTRESGVRSLTKKIAAVMRKLAWAVAAEEQLPAEITPELVREYLGKTIYSRDKYQGNEHPGVVVGLAWTSVGGEILFIESSLQPGQNGKLILTGSLGDVMKESATIALSYIRAHAPQLGIDLEQLKDKEIHIHVPEGAIPKDGPSAGITMVTSLVSAITRRKVRAHLAMTGEITLRGKVLPVGGIKEKILAAKRSGITDIILCRENEKDILEIKDHYLEGLTFHYVDEITEVLAFALLDEVVE